MLTLTLTNKQRMIIVDVLKYHYLNCCEIDKSVTNSSYPDEICWLMDFFDLYQCITASEPNLHRSPD